MTDGPGDWSHGPEWTEPGPGPDGLAGPAFDPGHEHEPLAYDDPHPEPDPHTESGDEPGLHPEADPHTETDPQPEADPHTEADPQPEPDPHTEAGPHDGSGGFGSPVAEPGIGAETGHDLTDGPDHDPAGPDPADVPDGTDASHVDSPEFAAPPDEAPFPPELHLDVAPADGQPWADPALLGTEPADGVLAQAEEPADPADSPDALLADLHTADGGDGSASASALAASDDPAIRALTAYWSR